MDQRRVMELVERFRVERGQATLAQLIALIKFGCNDIETLRQAGLTSMYWFANVVADDERETIATVLDENNYTDASTLVRGA